MIGFIRLTPVQGSQINVNPNHIAFFGKSSQALVKGINPDVTPFQGATAIVINNMFYQVKESEQEIISALTRLRKKQEMLVKNFKKELDREDWKGDTDQEDDDNY